MMTFCRKVKYSIVKYSKVKESKEDLEKSLQNQDDFNAGKPSEDYPKFIKLLSKIYIDSYQESRGFPCILATGIKNKDTNAIMVIFKNVVKVKETKLGIKLNTEEAIEAYTAYVKNAMLITDQFIYNSMAPTFLMSQFQKVLTLMMENNPNGKRPITATTDIHIFEEARAEADN